MSNTTSSALTEAQRAERRQRFFQALGNKAASEQHGQNQAQASTSEPQPHGSSSTSANSSSSSISIEAKARLMQLYSQLVFGSRSEQTVAQTKLCCRQLYKSSPTSELSADLKSMHSAAMELDGPLTELEQASMDTLPPQVQDLKRRLAAITPAGPDASSSADWDAITNRINGMLRAKEESEVPMDAFYDMILDINAGKPPGPAQAVVGQFFQGLHERQPELLKEIQDILNSVQPPPPPS